MATIREQITDLENTRAAKAAQMESIMQKGLDEGRSTDAAEAEEFDGLNAEIKKIDADLKRLSDLEKIQIAKAAAVPQTPAAPGQKVDHITVKSNAKPLEKGIGFARYTMCLAKAHGNPMMAGEIAKSAYPEMHDLHTVFKAAVAAGTTTDSTWAKPLVEYNTYAGDFLEYLRPQTIIGKFGVGNVPSLRRIPFNVRIVGQTTGGAAGWVGEGKAKPVTKFDFNDVTLGHTKIAGIAVLTDELIRFSNPAAEALVRDALRDAVVERMDKDFVDPTKAAVAGVSPASITNGVTAVTASGTGTVDNMRTDIQAIFSKYIAANTGVQSGVWLMSSTAALHLSMLVNALGQPEFPGMTMNGGTLVGLPVIVSDYIPAGTVIMVNASDVYLADDGEVMIDASREASIEMSDAPTANAVAGTGASMVSMFQTNSVAVRAERFVNWGKRRATAAQYVTEAVWAGYTAPVGP